MHDTYLCTTLAQADPWKPYDNPGKKPKPSIPEPMTYLGITLALLIVLAARWGRATKP